MMLDETNCSEKINALTPEDWQPLLALIPEIENTSYFGERSNEDKSGKYVINLSGYVLAPIVSRFLHIVHSIPIIIVFDWGAWNQGRKILGDESFDYDTIDLLTKCKIITAIVRNDRFCEGVLVSAFDSGLILKLLKSIERQVK